MRRLALLLTLVCACDAGPAGGDDDGPDAGDLAPDAALPADANVTPPGEVLGTFQLTYYWVASEGEHPGPADTALYDESCGLLATVSADFADAIALEGTGRLLDGRLLNVAGACACATTPCYAEADDAHPWGYGVQNRALEPFRSIAVDRDVIAYGTGIYLAELDGVTMPGDAGWGQFVHDGCVVAADTGGGIVGEHVDFFVGLRAAYRDLDGELGLGTITVQAGGDRCPDQP
ncbi:MAG: hypothetical protein H6708_14850 [Kofleriaceae bacterium]|nr:hypothetical protein [Myxococcales bacterium]MCB9561680.1 hypothetical protein [Kofleriaceae bacterium]